MDSKTARDVEAAHVAQVRDRIDAIAQSLRDMATDIERRHVDLDAPSTLTLAPYTRAASNVIHTVSWGVANLGLGNLARDAGEADAYRTLASQTTPEA